MMKAVDLAVRSSDLDIISNFSLRVRPGEIVVLVGGNGAGKSTAIKAITSEVKPSSGYTYLNEHPIDNWSSEERAQQLAILPQHSNLNFGLTAWEIVSLGRLPFSKSHSRSENAYYCEAAMTQTGTLHLSGRSYLTLSGGEKLRVHMARTIAQIAEPQKSGSRYLILDEPTSSLDIQHQLQCLEILRKLASDGVGILVVLHDLNLAMQIADEVYVMKSGKIIRSGHPSTVFTTEIIKEAFDVHADIMKDEHGTRSYIYIRDSFTTNLEKVH